MDEARNLPHMDRVLQMFLMNTVATNTLSMLLSLMLIISCPNFILLTTFSTFYITLPYITTVFVSCVTHDTLKLFSSMLLSLMLIIYCPNFILLTTLSTFYISLHLLMCSHKIPNITTSSVSVITQITAEIKFFLTNKLHHDC